MYRFTVPGAGAVLVLAAAVTVFAANSPIANVKAMARYVLGEPRTPQAPIVSRSLWPMDEFTASYDVAESGEPRGTPEIRLAKPAPGSRYWTYDRLGQRTEYVRSDDRGRIMLSSIDNVRQGLIIRFAPEVCVFPATMEPGVIYRSTSYMTVLERDNGSKVKAEGDAEVLVMYDADQTVRTPAGTFDCRRVTVRCEADFGWGSLQNTSIYYLAEGVGLVAEYYHTRTSVLLIPSTHAMRVVLKALPKSAPASGPATVAQ